MDEGMTIVRRFLDVEGVRLCCVDFGGSGSPVLLLHGLAGRGNEWHSTADWLTRRTHVFALDQRGHGVSERTPGDYTRSAYVSDAIQVIERLGIAPVILIGQSMGGINAFLVAARRPKLVRALIVVEASVRPNPAALPGVQKWFDSWPLPFPTLADARRFFSGETLYAQTWIEILRERPDGYWPQFDMEDMLRSIEDMATHDYMDEWTSIVCPTLVVGGADSFVVQEDLQEMARQIPHGQHVQIADAGHDLHLEQPAAWHGAIETFLNELDAERQ